MAKKLVAQAPPAQGKHQSRATSDLDQRIMAAARGKYVRPVEVARALGLPTHKVATRMKTLSERGLMERQRADGQINGPGASTYRTVTRKRAAA